MADILKLKKRAADFEAKRQMDKALAVYRDMIEVYESGEEDPIDIPLYNRVGDLLQRAGNLPEAVSVWEKAVDHYTEGGFYNPAIALCNKILRQSPGRTVVYYKLGRISAEKGFKADARSNFIEYAARMQKAGNLDEAFRALKEFADLVPDQGDVRVMLADQLLKADRKDEAIEQLQVLHAQLASDGREDEAQEIAAKMKAIDPTVEPRADGTASAAKSGGLVFLDLEPTSGPARGSHAVPVEQAPKVRPPMPSKVAKAVEGLELIDLGEEPPAAPKRTAEPAAPAKRASEPVAPAKRASEPPAPPKRAAEPAAPPKRPSAPAAGPLADDDLLIEPTHRGVEEPPADRGMIAGLETTSFGEIDLDLPDTAERAVPGIEGFDRGIAEPESETTSEPLDTRAAPDAEELDAEEPAAGGAGAAERAAEQSAAEQSAAGEPAELEFHVVDEPPVRKRAEPPVEQRTEPPVEQRTEPPAVRPIEPPNPATELSPDASLLDLESSDFVSFGDVEPPTDASTIGSGFDLLEIETSEGVHALPLEELDSTSIIEPAQEYVEAFSAPEPVEPPAEPPAAPAASAAAVPPDDDEDIAPIVEPVSARTTSVTLAFSVDSLREQLEDAPEDAGLRRQYAEALLDDGQRDEGIAELELSLAGYERDGDLDTAASIAEEIVRLAPTVIRYHQKRVEFAFRANDRRRLAEAYVELADALVHDGQASKARVVYQRVLDISPDDLRAQAALETIADAPVPEPTPVPRRSHAARATKATKAAPMARPAAAKKRERSAANDNDDFVSLGDWLRDEDAPKSTRMVVAEKEPTGDEQADFNDMLRAFKQGISDNVDEEDHEAHYDLGVAYKEMGLIDEAISEFQIALRGTTQRARAFEALGHCFVEKGQLAVASTILQRALNEPGIGDEDLVGVLYLLGAICEELQNYAEAKRYYQRVFAVDIQFRDVADRLDTVEKSLR